MPTVPKPDLFLEDDDIHSKNYPQWTEESPGAEENYYQSEASCETTKECIKTYKCFYKLYKICHYHLYKVCPRCGHEFDYYWYQGICPKCP